MYSPSTVPRQMSWLGFIQTAVLKETMTCFLNLRYAKQDISSTDDHGGGGGVHTCDTLVSLLERGRIWQNELPLRGPLLMRSYGNKSVCTCLGAAPVRVGMSLRLRPLAGTGWCRTSSYISKN